MMKNRTWPILVFAAVAIGVLACRSAFMGGVAPTPAAFEDHATLDVAFERAQSSGKPVLAFATADWCGPCQSFKRGALADESIAAYIAENTEPAYVDLTDGDDPDAAQTLRVRSIPALVLFDDGQEISRLEGGAGKTKLLDWLEDGVARASK